MISHVLADLYLFLFFIKNFVFEFVVGKCIVFVCNELELA